MQSAGDIRWRDDDAVRIAIALRRKIAALLPCLIPVGFELLGLVSLFHDSLRLLESFEQRVIIERLQVYRKALAFAEILERLLGLK